MGHLGLVQSHGGALPSAGGSGCFDLQAASPAALVLCGSGKTGLSSSGPPRATEKVPRSCFPSAKNEDSDFPGCSRLFVFQQEDPVCLI